jgi:GTP-binding protein
LRSSRIDRHIGTVKVLSQFVTSAADPLQFPVPSLPEIAFLGRSNVGKSSLINALTASKLAKTSNTPGRTQTINFFELRRPGKPHAEFFFVDLPGYGYARVPKEISTQWARFIEPYLINRSSLALCVVLVDVSIPPQKLDLQLVEWLQHAGRSFTLVATKADRISRNLLRKSLAGLAKDLAVAPDAVVPFSVKSQTGHAELWRVIQSAIRSSADL